MKLLSVLLKKNEFPYLAIGALIGFSFGICLSTIIQWKFDALTQFDTLRSNITSLSNVTEQPDVMCNTDETIETNVKSFLNKPRYLLVMSVGIKQKDIVNNTITKFSGNWTIVLLHYDDHVDGWDEFEWSLDIIHIRARKQTKWWFAKRFLHPDVVRHFDYIFLWDEDLDGKHFNPDEYIRLVKKYGLEISQPGIEAHKIVWKFTKRRSDMEVHKGMDDPKCIKAPHKPPCAGFVEIMAPVFSRKAWRCVWHLIQNDLIHGWGLDFALQNCAQPAHERIGVVDAQYVLHRKVPSLKGQGNNSIVDGVSIRCYYELDIFNQRMRRAEDYERNKTSFTHKLDF